jgi:hypothetical protein
MAMATLVQDHPISKPPPIPGPYSWLHSSNYITHNPVGKGSVKMTENGRVSLTNEWVRKVERVVNVLGVFLFSYEASYVQL